MEKRLGCITFNPFIIIFMQIASITMSWVDLHLSNNKLIESRDTIMIKTVVTLLLQFCVHYVKIYITINTVVYPFARISAL
jgi:hypothetical protein